MQNGSSPQSLASRLKARRGFATTYQARPMSEMNVTPFIDVLLVPIIMLIMVVPIATHSLDIPLPNGEGKFQIRSTNTVSIDAQDRLYWNGEQLGRQELLNQLATGNKGEAKPLLRFDPAPNASYDVSAKTIALIKDSGTKNFAFVDSHLHREFTRQTGQ